jgi:hypothetical protein
MDKNPNQSSTQELGVTKPLSGAAVAQVEQFRQALYRHFSKRADSLMDLVDAWLVILLPVRQPG